MSVTRLDVRPVEPRRRLELVMGAWDDLDAGDALELTLDHDPRCMYYTLKVERAGVPFTFGYLESGPEVWRVMVGKGPGGPRPPEPAGSARLPCEGGAHV